MEKRLRVHVVGIGGIGMSGIALILKDRGYEVSGSDIKESVMTQKLREKGIKVFIGHSPKNVKDADVVIYSSAVKSDNVEIVEAKKRKIPTLPRSDILSDVMRFKESIAVAGTHGKTTTSSMISTVFYSAGLNPTILVGGRLSLLGGINAQSGDGDWLIAEADESDGTFLKLSPSLSVITNIDRDHLDFYKSFESLKSAFVEFANRVAFYGKVFLCGECPNVRSILDKVYKRKATYGFSKSWDFYAPSVVYKGLGSFFEVYYKGDKLGNVKLNVPGEHNVLNAVATVAVCLEAGIPFSQVAEYLEQFRNASRRMELKGTVKGITFIDDYAHHPSEIKATYSAVKKAFPDREIIVLFQPHRYSRTKILWKEFIEVLRVIPNLFLCDIYPAGEKKIEGITAEKLAKECGAFYLGTLEEACKKISTKLKQGNVFLSMGAGDVTKAFDIIRGEIDE